MKEKKVWEILKSLGWNDSHDILALNRKNQTPLFYFISSFVFNSEDCTEALELVRSLISMGSDLEANDGHGFLLFEVIPAPLRFLELLIEGGINVNKYDQLVFGNSRENDLVRVWRTA